MHVPAPMNLPKNYANVARSSWMTCASAAGTLWMPSVRRQPRSLTNPARRKFFSPEPGFDGARQTLLFFVYRENILAVLFPSALSSVRVHLWSGRGDGFHQSLEGLGHERDSLYR